MKNLNFEEIIAKLEYRFPNINAVDSFEFSKEYKKGCSIWIRNASDITYTKKDKNTIYNTSYYLKNYDIEVYNKFDKWCNRYGWYASTENYTLQLFKI